MMARNIAHFAPFGKARSKAVPTARLRRSAREWRAAVLAIARALPTAAGALTMRNSIRPALISCGGQELSRARWRGPGVGARLGPQLAEDCFDVVVDGPHGDHEPVGDLAVLQALLH
jgi:hypothetical protein